MSQTSTSTVPSPRPTPPSPVSDRALLGWLDPSELERRLEAHLLIARKVNA